jgi:predicted transcriptional regulator
MSIEVMRYVWNRSQSKGNARLMLLAIADIANDSGDAFPGVDRLAKKCNLSRRRAQEVIRELERNGDLQVFENVGTKTASGWTNLYRVRMEGVAQPDVRTQTGATAQPRPIVDRKTRDFPKGAQLAAPLQDVQPSAPHDVQLAAPKPSVQPSDILAVTPPVRKTVPASEMNPMKDAIVAVFRYRWETMSDPEKGLVQKTARELCLAGVKPSEVPSLYDYCKKQFSSFKARALSTNISEWRKEQSTPVVSVLDGLRLVS